VQHAHSPGRDRRALISFLSELPAVEGRANARSPTAGPGKRRRSEEEGADGLLRGALAGEIPADALENRRACACQVRFAQGATLLSGSAQLGLLE